MSVRITDRSAYAEIKTDRGYLVAVKRGPVTTIVRELLGVDWLVGESVYEEG